MDELERQCDKKLVMEFPPDMDAEKIHNISKKMLKALTVDELAYITACRMEHTIMHIEKSSEEIDKCSGDKDDN